MGIGVLTAPTRPESNWNAKTMRIAVVVGNPNVGSRALGVAKAVAEAVSDKVESARDILTVDLAEIAPRLFEDESPTVRRLLDKVATCDLVVVASPTYKATFTGLLKSFLDRYNGDGLAGTVGVPLMSGAAPVHALAREIYPRPLSVELGAYVPSRGIFVAEQQFDDLDAVIAPWASVALPLIESVLRCRSSSTDPGQV
jgi:FMN reductase